MKHEEIVEALSMADSSSPEDSEVPNVEGPLTSTLEKWEKKLNAFNFCAILKSVPSPAQAMALFVWARRKAGVVMDSYAYNNVIRIVGQARRFQAVEWVLRDMETSGCRRDRWTFNCLLSVYGKAGMVERAEGVFEQMQREGVHPDTVTFNSLMGVYCRHGMVEKAEKVWADMEAEERVCPDGISFDLLIFAFCRAGLVEKAAQKLEEMERRGLAPRVHLYNCLMDAYGKAHLVEEAEQVWGRLREASLSPTVISYGTMIDLFVKAGQYPKALDLRAEMAQRKVPSNPKIDTMMIQLYAKQDRLGTARRIFSRLLQSEEGMNVVTWTSMIDLYGKAGRRTDALQLFKEMAQRGVRPSSHTYNSLIDMCGKAGMFEEVEMLYGKMLEDGLRPDTVLLSTLTANLGKFHRPGEAAMWFRRLVNSGGVSPNVHCFTSLMYAFFNAGMYREGQQVFQEMRRRGLQPGLPTFTLLLSSLTVCADRHACEVLLQLMEGCEQKAHEVLRLLQQVGEEGAVEDPRWVEVERLLGEMRGEKLEERQGFANALLEFLEKMGRHSSTARLWPMVEGYWVGHVAHLSRMGTWRIDVHGMSGSTARVATLAGLNSLREMALGLSSSEEGRAFPSSARIITGWGKRSRVPGLSFVKYSVLSFLDDLGSPFVEDGPHQGTLVAEGEKLRLWLLEKEVAAALQTTESAEEQALH